MTACSFNTFNTAILSFYNIAACHLTSSFISSPTLQREPRAKTTWPRLLTKGRDYFMIR